MQDQIRQIITIYCFCDDFLRAREQTDSRYREAPQARMTTAQVMTVALVAVLLFHGNQERSRCFLRDHGYIRPMLSKSRLNRRLHAVPEALWQALFQILAQLQQHCHNPEQASEEQASEEQALPEYAPEYAVDSLPVPVCDNIRIRRNRLYPRRQHGDAFRGYIASKQRYFYGLRLHLLITTDGLPVEMMLAPGSEADISAFRRLRLDLPAGSYIFADAGYLDQHEEALLEDAGLHLVAQRRGNSKRALPPWVSAYARRQRKRIETVFSQIASALGRTVHAVTARGFELKVFLTVLAYSLLA